jgi:type I restriction enzyme S subunit
MRWATKLLGEIADFRLGKMLDEKKNKGEYLPYLANINVRWGSFELDNVREMRFEPHEIEHYGLIYGDIVMCEGGEPGRCAIWKDERPGMMIQKALHRIRPHDCLDNIFLYYSFLYKGKTDGFSPLFTGATIKHLPRQDLAKVEVPVPPLQTQRRIASILSAYDDLIENNNRRIALLEESMHLLYREWFVRLRFPGHEDVRVVDGVPEAWHKKTLGDIVHEMRRLIDPSNVEPDIPYIGLEHIPRRSIALTDWGNANEVTSSKFWFEESEILFGKIRPYFHKVVFAPFKGICSSDTIVYKPRSVEYFGLALAVTSSVDFVNFTSQTSNEGSKMPRANTAEMRKYKILVPEKTILLEFNRMMIDITSQLSTLIMMNKRLAEARDLLLPRLMSGEMGGGD